MDKDSSRCRFSKYILKRENYLNEAKRYFIPPLCFILCSYLLDKFYVLTNFKKFERMPVWRWYNGNIIQIVLESFNISGNKELERELIELAVAVSERYADVSELNDNFEKINAMLNIDFEFLFS